MIGRKVLELRMQKGLSQGKLSEGICSRSMLSHIETGRTLPSLDLLNKLCQRLSVSIRELYEEAPGKDGLASRVEHVQELLAFQDYPAVIRQTRELLRLKPLADEPPVHFACLRLQGLALFYEQRYEEAILSFQAALDIASQHRLVAGMVAVYNSLGSAYSELGNVEHALECFLTAHQMLDTVRVEPRVEIRLVYNLARSFHAIGEQQKSVQYAKRGISLSEQTGIYECGGHLSTMLGLFESGLGKWKKAHSFFTKALRFYEFIGDEHAIAGAKLNLANTAWRMGERSLCTALIDEVLSDEKLTPVQKQEASKLRLLCLSS